MNMHRIPSSLSSPNSARRVALLSPRRQTTTAPSRASTICQAYRPTKAAFFDLDNTIVQSNIVLPYVLYKIRNISVPEMFVFIPTMLFKCLLYIIIDKFDRSFMNVLFYTNYRGFPTALKEDMGKMLLTNYFRPNLYPSAVLRLKELKSLGYRLVVVSGSLDFVVEPLAKELGFDDIICAQLEEDKGTCTGRLKGGPLSDGNKAKMVKLYGEMYELDLKDCVAYGDSLADLPMLEAVGNATVVNPSSKLADIAAQRGWSVVNWKKGGAL